MAQNTKPSNGCAAGIIRIVGGLMLISGLGNLFSGAGVAGIVVVILGAAMVFGGSGSKKAPRSAVSKPYQEPVRQAKQAVSRQVREATQMAQQRTAQRAARFQRSSQAETCDNPEPHRHYEMPRQPADNAERLMENRRTLFEAGLLTREEYDAEVRKLRGR